MRVKMLTGGAVVAGKTRARGDVFELEDDIARAYIRQGDMEPVEQEVRSAVLKPERDTLHLPRKNRRA